MGQTTKMVLEEVECRRDMVKLCLLTLHKHTKEIKSTPDINSKAFSEKLMRQARCVELLLYRDAATYDEYIDHSTFNRRFVQVVVQMKINSKVKRDMTEIIEMLRDSKTNICI